METRDPSADSHPAKTLDRLSALTKIDTPFKKLIKRLEPGELLQMSQAPTPPSTTS